MMMLTMPKMACDSSSISLVTGRPRSPSRDSEKPNRMAISSTCRMSPLAKASTKVFGMMFITKSMVDMPSACVYCAIDLASRWAGSALKPAPGLRILATSKPMASAKVETTSKYSSALPPTRPIFLTSCMPAMPETTVQKITGAMIILISLIKPSPSGFMSTALEG
ncbi:hypothetical protein D3C86_95480 [compost metagenome]